MKNSRFWMVFGFILGIYALLLRLLPPAPVSDAMLFVLTVVVSFSFAFVLSFIQGFFRRRPMNVVPPAVAALTKQEVWARAVAESIMQELIAHAVDASTAESYRQAWADCKRDHESWVIWGKNWQDGYNELLDDLIVGRTLYIPGGSGVTRVDGDNGVILDGRWDFLDEFKAVTIPPRLF